MVVSALSFTAMSVYVKRLSGTVPPFELVFFRSAVNLAWVAALIAVRRESLWPSQGKALLVFRGLVGFLGVACMFHAIAHLPLPIAAMLNWSSPLFVILFSRIALKERMPAGSTIWIVLAFLGVLLLLDPFGVSAAVPFPQACVGLLAAVFGGMAYVSVRAAMARVSADLIVFYFVSVSTLLAAPLAWSEGVWPTSSETWFQIFLLGTFAAIAQLTMTRAYRYARAGVVSMMNLLNPLFVAGLGLLIFREPLDALQWFGMTLLLSAMTGLTLRRIK